MNRTAVLLSAVASFGLAVAVFLLAWNLILPLPVMIERDAEMPWYITWGMVWVTVLCAAGLGVFLLTAAPRRR